MYVSTLGGAIYFVSLFFIQILPFFEDVIKKSAMPRILY